MKTQIEAADTWQQIDSALGVPQMPAVRKMAARVLMAYVMEFHRYGWNPAYDKCGKMIARFHLGDLWQASVANFPMRQS